MSKKIEADLSLTLGQKIRTTLRNYSNKLQLRWAPNQKWLSDDFDEMECVWRLREPFIITCFCTGWINNEECREAIYSRYIWDHSENWKNLSDIIYDPVDNYFAPTENPRNNEF